MTPSIRPLWCIGQDALVASFAQWVSGARPRTLPNAVAPVVAGTGAAAWLHSAVWWKALLALAVSVALIIGVNYANDYSDGIRGTDDERAGPVRLVGSRLAAPRSVLTAALTSLSVGAVAGLALALLSAPWLIAVGAACIAGAWLYTGGSKPYGYAGFGEAAGVGRGIAGHAAGPARACPGALRPRRARADSGAAGHGAGDGGVGVRGRDRVGARALSG